MGTSILRLAEADPRVMVVAAVARVAPTSGTYAKLDSDALDSCPEFDVAIDFSLPDGFDAVLATCVSRRAALVSGTTGLLDRQRAALTSAGANIPIVWASNFSLGVVVMESLLRQACVALAGWQVEVHEVHHVHKLDAPSGTALTLARAVESVSGSAPAISSRREGEVIGDHRVSFDGPGERLEIGHQALDRDVFAHGAIEAATRLRKPGLWTLEELIFEV